MKQPEKCIKTLIATNLISLIIIVIISFHYDVPKNLLIKLGILETNNSVIDLRRVAKNGLFSEYHQKNYRIVMLGDSITEWVAWNELLGITDIANRGIASDSTEGFYNRLSTVYSVNPEMCFIMGGINDILRDVSVEAVLQNITTIIKELKKNEIKPIIQSTLYISKKLPEWETVNKAVDELNIGLESICREKTISFIDVNTALSADGALENENTYDGIHLNSLGYKKWAKLLLDVIENN